jgi:hypothetical protein
MNLPMHCPGTRSTDPEQKKMKKKIERREI